MVVLQEFIDYSYSVLRFSLLLMKHAVKEPAKHRASAGWEACHTLNVLQLNFIALRLHRDIHEPYCTLIWNGPRKVFLILWEWNFSLYGTFKKLLNARVQSDFANVNFSRDIWYLKKNCWWLLHLASNFFFFFNLENMYGFFSKRNVCTLWFMLYSCHGKKRDPVYGNGGHIRKIKRKKNQHDIFLTPSRTHIPEVLWVSL